MVDPPKLEQYEACLMARQRPSIDFTSEATNLVAVMVGDLVEKSTQGDIVFEEREDILIVALGTNECSGRIHTTPRGVAFNKFFGKISHSTLRGITTFKPWRDLTELISGIKWISISILYLWCSYLHGMCVFKNVRELFGFLDPNRTLLATRESVLRSYLGGYHLLRGVDNKKPNWKIVKAHRQDNRRVYGYYVMKNMFDVVDTSIVERFDEISIDTSPYEKETMDHIRKL
ncbi:unnamed protein product [Vicia faba]|uniref:Uncharacterized protein n=1 Tax=Vicia faba TaxID=3906 RepID=A0AAV1AXV4_VICFA|nr:unnamed protein product [Vicia faba]